MQKRNKARRVKTQNDQFEVSFERSEVVLAWIDGFQQDTQRVDELISEFSELLGM